MQLRPGHEPSTAKGQRRGYSKVAPPCSCCVRRIEKVPRKSPEKPVDDAKWPSQNSWSGTCAYAEGHEEPTDLVAGVIRHRATFGLQMRRSSW